MPLTLPPFDAAHTFQWNALLLFGGVLLAGLLGGHLVAKNPWIPRITGYLLVGFLLGAGGVDFLSGDVLKVTQVFGDIALALVVYQLGRYVDIGWLKNERWLLITVLTNALLCVLFVWMGLTSMGLPGSLAVLIGMLAIGTSPAIVMVVIRDLGAEGHVTRRLATMTALSNLVALLAVNLALPVTAADPDHTFGSLLLNTAYTLFGSLLLAYVTYWIMMPLARLIGRERSRQFVLVIAVIMLTIGAAHALALPVLLTMLAFAILSKNLDRQYDLMELEFGVATELFIVMLFVTMGATITLSGLSTIGPLVLVLILARYLATATGIFAFARPARLRWKQAGLLSLGMLPMSVASTGFAQISGATPQTAAAIAPVLAGTLIVLELFGPVIAQFALIKSGESGRE